MAKVNKFKIDEVIKAIQIGQTPAGAAKVLKCHPDTIRNYAKRSTKVKNELESARETLIDMAEFGLKKALGAYESWAIAFTLKTLGKKYGYVERQEFTGADGDAMNIRINWDANDND